ncbi:trypsin-like peptidase domain-containing protein [Egicoccus sp. AB-alg2]|uniref:S1C family serine protease n=1 Tax=Egicoccus sp. AB-alg2 TaxID=3242693 RepID=UPI00359DF520
MSYDREEWRRPWRGEETPGAFGGATPFGREASRVADAETSAPDEPTASPPDGAPVATDEVGPAVRDAGTWPDRPQFVPGRVDTARLDAPGAGSSVTEPIARFPQPPPSGWSEASAGPGSPAGSVRPPDTTGTVDAPEKRGRGRGGVLLALVAALIGGMIGTAATLALVLPGGDAGPSPISAPAIEVEGDLGAVVPAVAQAVTPSVVRIDVTGVPAAGPAIGGTPALGSGVIYRSDGYVLTNHHVVDGADDVRVRLSSGDVLDAELVGSDELNDLAVLRVERDDLPAVNLRDTVDEPLIVGEQVVAIGSPFGLDASVTSGIISALNREIRVDEQDNAALVIPSVIQTDAAINPGNSGGALVDARGRLVGINTAILTRTGASQGVGFAVSAEQAIVSADQLIEAGFVRHPLLGISGIDVTPETAEEFGLEAPRGALVDSVQDGTGAAEAGMRPGDIIVEVDGEPLATMSELVAEVRRRQPGEVVQLGVVRDGEELTVDVTLGERPR